MKKWVVKELDIYPKITSAIIEKLKENTQVIYLNINE